MNGLAAVYDRTLAHFLAPIGDALADADVTEILINGPDEIFVERRGRLARVEARFADAAALEAAARNIAQFTGKRLVPEVASVEARLPDGSRVHIVQPPAARKGVCVSIRKFSESRMDLDGRRLRTEARRDLVAQRPARVRRPERHRLARGVRARPPRRDRSLPEPRSLVHGPHRHAAGADGTGGPVSTLTHTIERLRARLADESETGGAPDMTAADGGYVMVMLALTITLLLTFAGYSVDAGNWNLHRNEVRTAAEAAALGGVAFLPDDLATAQTTAEQIARLHGFDDSDADTTVTVGLASGNNQLEVTISHDVSNYFVRVIGMETSTITSTATAEFEQPVEMGSPEHVLGNDPETGLSPDYWLSIAARGVRKDLGDRFNTRRCVTGTTANCAGTWNQEYDNSGYKYAVRVTDTSQDLRIQIFDPAWTWTGSTCNIPNWPTAAEVADLQSIDDGSNPNIPLDYYDDAAARYASGDTAWCVGDDRPGSSGPATRYTVRLPDDSPWDDNDNTVINITGCRRQTFPAYTPTSIYAAPTQSIYELLHPTGPGNEWQVRDNGTLTFAEVFRRWVTICEIPAGSPWLREGDYIVQVQTTTWSEGQNRFSLRAGPPSGSNGVLDVGQATFARGRFPIYANTGSADIQFFLARVPPSSGERILEVTFFDVGDAAVPGTLSVVPPPGALAGGAFTTCEYTLAGVPLTSTNCEVTGVLDAYGYGEQLVEATVRIPSQNDPVNPYWCDVSNPNDCWVTVRAQFSGGMTDATTWTASLIGDAVRLLDTD